MFSCEPREARLRLLPVFPTIKGTAMAVRAGFAAASVLGVVTTAGTTLWLAAVAVLAGLVIALFALETRPRLHRKQI